MNFVPLGPKNDKSRLHEALSRNVPLVQSERPHKRQLAVVGSGPSVEAHLRRLKKWRGDIWAINGTVRYLLDAGIQSTFVSVDPYVLPEKDFNRVIGAEAALLSAACDPALFDAYSGRARRFYIAANENAPFVVTGGCSTATRLPFLALKMGYRDVTFFGCEGSYEQDSHVYGDLKLRDELWIRAGHTYRTDPQLLMQCQYLSDLIRKFPQGFSEKSGGLLRGMIFNDWTTVRASGAFNFKERNYDAVSA